MKDKAKDQIDESITKYVDAMHVQNIAVMEMLMNENKYLREKEREDKASFEGRFVKIFDEAKKMGLVDMLMKYMLEPPISRENSKKTAESKVPSDSPEDGDPSPGDGTGNTEFEG